MKERINKLAKGIVELDFPQLKLSDLKYEGVVQSGEISKFELLIISENGVHIKGLLYSTDNHVVVKKTAFGGVRTKIICEIDTRHLQDKDTIEGELHLVSNAGELSIPYTFTVRAYASAEIISTLHTAKDFSLLFTEEEELALRVFDYDDFDKAEFMDDARTRSLYEGLKASPDRRTAAIEFLKALRVPPAIKKENKEKAAAAAAAAGLKPTKSVRYKKEVQKQALPLYPELVEDPVLIEKAASICIREGVTESWVYGIYGKAIENGSSITRLYDYYLNSLPKNYEEKLPREVYLYFAYENSINENIKLPLYYNILMNFTPDSDIYHSFERQIQEYAIENMLESKINHRLALIYDRMILPDMVDENLATVLPAILRSYRVETDDKRIAYVVVRYLELNIEEVFPLKDGAAYIPIFFENNILLFQDAFGNRYLDVPCRQSMIMQKPDLEKKCFEVCPEHPMLRLAAVRNIARNGIQTRNQLHMISEVLSDMDVSKMYRDVLIRVALKYFDTTAAPEKSSITDEDTDFLKTIDTSRLDINERESLVRAFIKLGLFDDAYHTLMMSGVYKPDKKLFESLVLYLIKKDAPGRHEDVLRLAYRLFQMGSTNKEIVTFLLDNYNGLSSEMLRVLTCGQKLGLDTARMNERLLAQMIFTRSEEAIDQVYESYTALPETEPVLDKAYITMKSIDSFIYGQSVPETVFKKLYTMISDEKIMERIPTIYILALTKHMAYRESLISEEKLLLQDMEDLLIQKKLVFAYTKTLSRFIHLPDYIMDKAYIEYHGSKQDKPTLMISIKPDSNEYQEEEITRVYQNIYVQALVLFAGESADYLIYEQDKGSEPVESGTVHTDGIKRSLGDTYDMLNEMSMDLKNGSDKALRDGMLKYVKHREIIKELFTKEK